MKGASQARPGQAHGAELLGATGRERTLASGLGGAAAHLPRSLGLEGGPATFLPRVLEAADGTALGDLSAPRGLGEPGHLSEPWCPRLENREDNPHKAKVP